MLYLLKKNGYYWRPNSCGYTDSVLFAGTYTEEESASICGRGSGEITRIPLDEVVQKTLSYWEIDRRVLAEILKEIERIDSTGGA